MARSLVDKIWDAHVVRSIASGQDVVYIDRHLIHEVTSPQAFDEIAARNLPLFRPNQIIATADHNVPTLNQHLPIEEPLSRSRAMSGALSMGASRQTPTICVQTS